jgi:hypothetical protein
MLQINHRYNSAGVHHGDKLVAAPLNSKRLAGVLEG